MVNKNYKVLVGGLCLALASGCGSDEQGYKPKPVYSGTKPTLPGVPTLPNAKRKDGDAYTVYGASHDLRSQVHKFSFRDQPTSIVGWIVRTNYEAAPDCAIHEMGEADPPGCEAPTPGFWIADSKDDTKNAIGVMGWAANLHAVLTINRGSLFCDR